jgi:hypothetical protein
MIIINNKNIITLFEIVNYIKEYYFSNTFLKY